MTPEDAEEYTQALEQVQSGGWRQVLLGVKLGVPEALGMPTRAWARRIGGHLHLSIGERQEAARELLAPEAEGGQGLSTRQAAEVLGVSHNTVAKDARPVTDVTARRKRLPAPGPAPVTEMTEMPALPALLEESPAERAYFALSRQTAVTDRDPLEVAEACPNPATTVRVFEDYLDWLSRFLQALRARTARPIRAVK